MTAKCRLPILGRSRIYGTILPAILACFLLSNVSHEFPPVSSFRELSREILSISICNLSSSFGSLVTPRTHCISLYVSEILSVHASINQLFTLRLHQFCFSFPSLQCSLVSPFSCYISLYYQLQACVLLLFLSFKRTFNFPAVQVRWSLTPQ